MNECRVMIVMVDATHGCCGFSHSHRSFRPQQQQQQQQQQNIRL